MHSTDFIAGRDGVEAVRPPTITICQPDALELARGTQLPRPRPTRIPELFRIAVLRNPANACPSCGGTGRQRDATSNPRPCPDCSGSGCK